MTTEETKLPRHINTAVTAIQKQIQTYEKQRKKISAKIHALTNKEASLGLDIEGLQEQITKLKG
jgi:peptidoglycan hydrolase CwlO-like protein